MSYYKKANQYKEQIKENWFKDHVATITREEGAIVLDWARADSGMYAVRYIFSNQYLFVSGDIGDAVFRLTWRATPESFDTDIHIDYLMGKLTCSSRTPYDYDTAKGYNEFIEWFKDYTEDREVSESERLSADEVESAFLNSSRSEELLLNLNSVYDNGSTFDSEDFSMFSDFGKELNISFYAYLIGIQMANEQLKVTQ